MDDGGGVRAGVVLVEYHSGGLVSDRVAECDPRHLFPVVADNSGTHTGPGLVVDTGGNVGFGAACNRAVAALPDDLEVVVLMNPDVHIAEGDLGAMVEAVASGEWDLLAPVTRTRSGVRRGFALPSAGREPGLTVREWVRSRRASGAPQGGTVPADPAAAERSGGVVPCPPDRFGSAALLVVRRSAFAAVGGFDESFFLYVEDADLWDRLVSAGARAGFATDALLVHDSATGSAGSTARRVALRRLGIEHYLARRGRSWWVPRAVHRLLLPGGAAQDPIIGVIDEGYRHRRSPGEIQSAVRSVAFGAASESG